LSSISRNIDVPDRIEPTRKIGSETVSAWTEDFMADPRPFGSNDRVCSVCIDGYAVVGVIGVMGCKAWLNLN
jgi:hypothetical protein